MMTNNELQQQIKTAIDNQSVTIAHHLSEKLAMEVDVMPDVFEGMLANQLYFELEQTLLPEILKVNQKTATD